MVTETRFNFPPCPHVVVSMSKTLTFYCSPALTILPAVPLGWISCVMGQMQSAVFIACECALMTMYSALH